MIQKTSYTPGKWGRIILLVGDLITLMLFVYAGQRDHGTMDAANPILGILLASWEFALFWLVAGWPLGAFPRSGEWTIHSLFARPLLTWLVAAPLGLLLRAFVLDRLVIPTLFFAATLGFGIVFLFGWRLVFVLGWKTAVRRKESIGSSPHQPV